MNICVVGMQDAHLLRLLKAKDDKARARQFLTGNALELHVSVAHEKPGSNIPSSSNQP